MTSRAYLPFRQLLVLTLALLLCGFAHRASAQSTELSPVQSPIRTGGSSSAQISIQSPSVTASTNEQGRYYINDLLPGTYDLTITYLGLDTFHKK